MYLRNLPLLLFMLAATTNAWSQTSTAPAIGNGSNSNPYRIATLENLYWLSQTDSVWGKSFIQTADIDAGDTKNCDNGQGFSPIGNSSIAFTGNYHGQNHVIKNLYIYKPTTDYVGLFGYVKNDTIDSLGLIGCYIVGNKYAGLIGYALATKTVNLLIGNCYSTGTINCTDNAGGILGYAYSDHYSFTTYTANKSINNCYSTATINCTNNGGGIIGYAGNNISINKCYSTGTINCTYCTGGIIGNVFAYASSDTANISINSCYSTANINCTSNGGGIIGKVATYGNAEAANISINNCYSIATINCTSNGGGVIGYNFVPNVNVNNVYWNSQTTGQAIAIGTNEGNSPVLTNVTSLTTAQMKDSANFTDFDFTNTWAIRVDSTYPALRGVSNNAPFAFRDTEYVASRLSLKNLMANDYDYESLQKNLVVKVDTIYGAGTTNLLTWFAFPDTVNTGYIDSLQYRVGEINDGDTLWGNTAIAILVKYENTAPIITSTAPGKANEDVEYTYTLTAIDSEGDVLTYNLSNQPSGMVLTDNVITWTPGNGVNTSGEVTLTASDGLLTDTETFTITVSITNALDEKTLPSECLYPNPCTTGFTISTGIQSSMLYILDLTGKQVLSQQVSGISYVNIESLKAGMYVVKVNDMNFKLVKK